MNQVHQMRVWAYAHKEARRSSWMSVAADRFRFNNRIAQCERLLNFALSSEHRKRIYNERFVSYDIL
jgi:hypothetical protein